MVLVKILKRRDASSVVAAIVVGYLLLQFIQTLTNKWALKISNVNYGPVSYHWKEDFLMPLVWLLLELILLEVICWLYAWLTSGIKKK
jgi:hypothetical protein